jgi:hypothetical protein
MLRLHETQRAFAEAILKDQYSGLTGMIVPGGSGLRSAALYRRLIRTNYTQVLAVTFPALRRFLGAHHFDLLGRGYSKKYSSTSGDLFAYGRYLPRWLFELQASRLLIELARLEWACHEVYQAPDSRPLCREQLETIAMADPRRVTFRLHAAIRLLRVSLPVHHLWHALQPDVPTAMMDRPLPEDETCIVVTRADGVIQVTAVAALDFRLIEAMADRKNAAELEQMAMESDPEFDFARLMASILDLNVLAGVSVGERP